MNSNSILIDVIQEFNIFKTERNRYDFNCAYSEFDVYFVYAESANKVYFLPYLAKKDEQCFNILINSGIKNLKRYLSSTCENCVFIYATKNTKKALLTAKEFHSEKEKHKDYFNNIYNCSIHIKDIFKNINNNFLDISLAYTISQINNVQSIYKMFNDLDEEIQIKCENSDLILSNEQIFSLFNYKDFNKNLNMSFNKECKPTSLEELRVEVFNAIKRNISNECKCIKKPIFMDLEAIDYSCECTSIGVVKDNNIYHKIIKTIKNTKPTKFMVNLTGITREMILNGTLFSDMLDDLYNFIPEFDKYSFIVFGVYDKVIWKKSIHDNLTENASKIYNYIFDNMFDFSAIVNKYMVDYIKTNSNYSISLLNGIKFLDLTPIKGEHNPVVDSQNLNILYDNFFKEENYHKYIYNNLSLFIKKSISSSSFKTILYYFYSNNNSNLLFKYYMKLKLRENLKNCKQYI